jgi:hypothetical protein
VQLNTMLDHLSDLMYVRWLASALCSFAGLPIRLPDFLWQSVNIIAAAEQPLLRLPLCAAVRLIRVLVLVFTHVDCETAYGIKWSWAADALQQLLNCAVAAGLMQALPLGTAAKASQLCQGGSSIVGGSNSSSRERYAAAMSKDIIMCATSLLSHAEVRLSIMGEDVSECTVTERELLQEICHDFTHQPVAAEVVLQLLASRSMLMHQQLQAVQQQRQQQQLQLSPRLGKRMRGDLLLLSDPQPRLAPLLPAVAFLAAYAAVGRIGSSSSSSSSSENSLFSVEGMCEMVLLLHMQLLALKIHGRSDNKSVAASLLTLSGPALQLTAELLLLAAVHWQQLYHDLTGRQQQLLNLPDAEVPRAEV